MSQIKHIVKRGENHVYIYKQRMEIYPQKVQGMSKQM
jgi:hypothetical protein